VEAPKGHFSKAARGSREGSVVRVLLFEKSRGKLERPKSLSVVGASICLL
jgi:hypothetical protein